MNRTTRAAASTLGIYASLLGMEHGYFEILQRDIRPEGLMSAPIGPPCVPEEVWNTFEPPENEVRWAPFKYHRPHPSQE